MLLEIKKYRKVIIEGITGKYGKSIALLIIVIIIFFLITKFAEVSEAFTKIKDIYFPRKEALSAQVTPTPHLLPTTALTPVDNCKNENFLEQQWDTGQYEKDSDDYFLPKAEAKKKFLFPQMVYYGKISAVFKKIDIVYEATYQNKQGSTSATLFTGLYDDNDNIVFTFEIPQPNRQLIGRKVMGDDKTTQPKVTPKVVAPLNLFKRIPYFGTNEITITTISNYKNNVIYVLSGSYLDDDAKPQPIYIETPVELSTVNPSIKDFTFVVGTGRQGKLKIKSFTLCDL